MTQERLIPEIIDPYENAKKIESFENDETFKKVLFGKESWLENTLNFYDVKSSEGAIFSLEVSSENSSKKGQQPKVVNILNHLGYNFNKNNLVYDFVRENISKSELYYGKRVTKSLFSFISGVAGSMYGVVALSSEYAASNPSRLQNLIHLIAGVYGILAYSYLFKNIFETRKITPEEEKLEDFRNLINGTKNLDKIMKEEYKPYILEKYYSRK